MSDPDQWVQDNYRQLAADRGVELADLAGIYERHDPQLAAWMRSQASPQSTDRKQPPRARRAPTKDEG